MRALLTALAVSAIATGVSAQQAVVPPPASDPETRLHTDWAWLGRYRDDDAAPIASHVKPRVVFIGDSITEGWRDKMPAFFGPAPLAEAAIGRALAKR
ncbi:GDSL family lipase (fragment) [Sphingomonas sp. EC-HK361]|uniref:hypothetical protein n=1 Tax=Sphingomonas sp. EC-HK361 TaxID=2038397 RepID=UPI0012534D79